MMVIFPIFSLMCSKPVIIEVSMGVVRFDGEYFVGSVSVSSYSSVDFVNPPSSMLTSGCEKYWQSHTPLAANMPETLS